MIFLSNTSLFLLSFTKTFEGCCGREVWSLVGVGEVSGGHRNRCSGGDANSFSETESLGLP